MTMFGKAREKVQQVVASFKPKELVGHLLSRNAKNFERFLGLHITPVHFYSPIPEINQLDPQVFDKIYDCQGIDWNLEEQFRYARDVFPAYRQEFTPPLIPSFDCFILHSMIREKKPKIMVEVGAGGSTIVSLAALEQNQREGHDFKLCSFEPYPRAIVREIRNPSFTLLEKKVQEMDLDFLSTADLVFIDSSHVSKCDSDVNFLMLELMPRLKVGAVVQFHDIMIPKNYPKKWIEGGLFFNESYLLHSFLMFNKAFKVIWASQYMLIKHPDVTRKGLEHMLAHDEAEYNVSFWIERVA